MVLTLQSNEAAVHDRPTELKISGLSRTMERFVCLGSIREIYRPGPAWRLIAKKSVGFFHEANLDMPSPTRASARRAIRGSTIGDHDMAISTAKH